MYTLRSTLPKKTKRTPFLLKYLQSTYLSLYLSHSSVSIPNHRSAVGSLRKLQLFLFSNVNSPIIHYNTRTFGSREQLNKNTKCQMKCSQAPSCSSCSEILFDGNIFSNNRIQRGLVKLAVLPLLSALWSDGEKSEPVTTSATSQDMKKLSCYLASLRYFPHMKKTDLKSSNEHLLGIISKVSSTFKRS